MPLRSIESTEMGGYESVPWVKLADIENRACAIVQGWGWLGEKFQVCLLLESLDGHPWYFEDDGTEVWQAAVSFDADQKDNPRRKWLDHFADQNADPIGPVAFAQIPAKNQQGWVWGVRKCPLPVEGSARAETVQRSLHQQGWRAAAERRHRELQEEARAAARRPLAGRRPTDDDGLDDLPF